MTYPGPWRVKFNRLSQRRLRALETCGACGGDITKGQAMCTTLWERRKSSGVREHVTTRRHTQCELDLIESGCSEPTETERAEHHWRQRSKR